MSYTYSFADNAEYGADDLNALVRSLVTSGVSDPFEGGKSYNAEKLNDIIKTIYSEGVVPESVSTLKVSRVSDGTIAIAPGLAFFADGSTIRITAAHELSYTPGVKNYVYLKQDLTEQNRNYPVCSTAAPTTNDDVVMLAEITAGGSIEDKRTYARGRVPGYQSNANCSMVIEKDIQIDKNILGNSGETSFAIDMGTNNYSRVFVIVNGSSSGQMGVYSLTDKTYFCTCVFKAYEQITTDRILVGCKGGRAPLASLTFSVSGSTLTGRFKWNVSGFDSTTYPFTMILC